MTAATKSRKRYHYRCTTGRHEFSHPAPQKKCIGYWLGSPCDAAVTELR